MCFRLLQTDKEFSQTVSVLSGTRAVLKFVACGELPFIPNLPKKLDGLRLHNKKISMPHQERRVVVGSTHLQNEGSMSTINT